MQLEVSTRLLDMHVMNSIVPREHICESAAAKTTSPAPLVGLLMCGDPRRILFISHSEILFIYYSVLCGSARFGAARCVSALFGSVNHAARCCSARCGAFRCGAVRFGAVRRGLARCGAVSTLNTVGSARCGAVWRGAARFGAVRRGLARCGAVLVLRRGRGATAR
jgi:hypothetical protein